MKLSLFYNFLVLILNNFLNTNRISMKKIKYFLFLIFFQNNFIKFKFIQYLILIYNLSLNFVTISGSK